MSRYIQKIYNSETKNTKKTWMTVLSFEDFVGSAEKNNRRSYLFIIFTRDIQKFSNCSTFSECILGAFTKDKSLGTVNEFVYGSPY